MQFPPRLAGAYLVHVVPFLGAFPPQDIVQTSN
uniref:Uncharacterized protein n=1 Tax=Arundo donax TaxID=35708 RepID=A0A0A8Z091_ARUDO